ncbi:MAG TPA: ShlB/FhaC/HecB family hemolysin secretion/activation protein [Sphingobium sp.]|uniref:ShlB/FhaC/HecB family hemolysin secretion/activation protein n=1 Tax=Sphingobium sp. TaxID=1912891 RepID=UPI002ED4A6E5
MTNGVAGQRITGLVVGAVAALTLTGAAGAQTSAGRAVLPTREDLNPVPEAAGPPQSRLSIVSEIERSPCPLADPKFAGVTVLVNNVTFNNLKGVAAEDLRPAWAPFAGTRQPVAILCEIRDAAATIVRNRGYLAAVQVPTQRIENGEIRMELLYARVVAVRARGETQGAEAMIARYLKPLSEDEVFDRNRAERYLLLARDLPGYNVQLTLKPAGTVPGEVVGEVTVVRRPYAVDFTVQNLSSRAVGRWGGQVRAQFFGLTGMGDATSISLYSTADFAEQQILQIGHEFRLGGNGLKIAGQFTQAWTAPDIGTTDGSSPLKAWTSYGSIEASYPLVLRQSHSLTAAGGFDIVDQRVNFTGIPITRDRLRVVFARLSGEAIDLKAQRPRWRLSGTVELRKGISIFGATDCGFGCSLGVGASRPDGDPNAGLIRMSGVAEVALGRILALAVAPRAQFAFDPIFAFEEFTAGNYTIGRGFDPGTVSGDNGVGATIELRAAGFNLGKMQGLTLRPYLFADGAHIWDKKTSLSQPARGLISLGGGLRADFTDRFRLDATLAVPTDTAGFVADRSARFLMTLTTRILPWSDR